MQKFELPMLYHKSKNGTLCQWRVWAEGAKIYTEYGQVGGKLQIASKEAEPKNTGKANATTAEEQAVKEAQAAFKFKRDRKYSDTPERAQEELMLPMLAHKYEDRKNRNVSYPASLQRKYNGFRALCRYVDDEIVFFSRAGKIFALPHLSAELKSVLPKDMILDGELYSHELPLQKIASLAKKLQPDTVKINYYVYDVPSDAQGDDSLAWEQRLVNLQQFFSNNPQLKSVKEVETFTINSEEEVIELFNQFQSEGYEGGIVRLYDGHYQFGYRSNSLLKVKSFLDEDYKIIDWQNGSGKFEKCCIWTCETESGLQFTVVHPGTLEEKAEALRNASKYMGKYLTVKFSEYTPDGKPFHPVGLAIREDFDR